MVFISQQNSTYCPLGFICDNGRMANCTDIRETAINTFHFGDLHAGSICPLNSSDYQICPVGMYCPDPVTILPCPKGMFCPHKTAIPEIVCDSCEMASTARLRENIVIIVLPIVFGIVLLYIIYYIVVNNKCSNDNDNEQELHRRSLFMEHYFVRKKERLENVKNKLDLISKRLSLLKQEEEKSVRHSNNISNTNNSTNNISTRAFDEGQNEAEKLINSNSNNNSNSNRNNDENHTVSREMRRSGMEDSGLIHVGLPTREVTWEDDQLPARMPPVDNDQKNRGNVDGEPQRRIRDSGDNGTSDNLPSVSISAHGTVTFDAEKLFYELDTDGSGDLSYEELNKILQLSYIQKIQFVRRMNELGGKGPESTTVSKRIFTRYFIKVLDETSNFGPTKEEAGKLFDRIAKEAGTPYATELDSDSFFTSCLSNFLNEMQINNLISMFERNKKQQQQQNQATMMSSRRYVDGNNIPDNNDDEMMTTARDDNNFRNNESGRSKRAWGVSMRKLQQSSPQLFNKKVTRSKFKSTWSRRKTVSRDEFIEYYPPFLDELISNPDTYSFGNNNDDDDNNLTSVRRTAGIDIAFDNLSLSVKVGKKSVNILEKVTGRIKAKSLTAIMGGSGTGKTSLLNTLCGRAYYGKVSGTIKLNGHEAKIEDHKGAIGFVPQDDIMYEELTVKENLLFSGMFRLPRGTTIESIEDLANATMASLRLSRVAHTVVGGTTKRGVSGGEKKRVNIGLELMARPAALFLDEPTSGLDASSASGVMESLKYLQQNQGVTVCCVIHQPRKVICDLFDSLIVMGVYGKMVYHGPFFGALPYFENMGYTLPKGDSVADYILDVSSGRAEPEEPTAENELGCNHNAATESRRKHGPCSTAFDDTVEEESERIALLYKNWDNEVLSAGLQFNAPEPYPLPEQVKKASFLRQVMMHMHREMLVAKRKWKSKLINAIIIIGVTLLLAGMQGVVVVTTSDGVYPPSFDTLVSEDPNDLVGAFPDLFFFAIGAVTDVQKVNFQMALILSMLVALSTAKVIAEKRVEFFREAGSGYNINAYFLSINIITTIEISVTMVIAALGVFWLRSSLASIASFIANFFVIGWTSASLAILIALAVPPQNVFIATAAIVAGFGLLLSGGSDPVTYLMIYDSIALQFISAYLAPIRFFIESLTVGEFRCLPQQTGYTVEEDAFDFPMGYTSFDFVGLAQNDYTTVIVRSCDGWLWGILPAFLVGLTTRVFAGGVNHISGRSRQAKTSLTEEWNTQIASMMRGKPKVGLLYLIVYFAVVILLFYLTAMSFL